MIVDWQIALIIIFGSFFCLLVTGIPVAFCFFLVNMIGIVMFWGGFPGLHQLGLSIFDSLTSFVLAPVVLFIFMGEIMFRSGIASDMLHTIDLWLGRMPGRLSLLAVATGTLLGTLTGAEMATVAILGKGLIPDMEKKGYSKAMTLGPILGSGGLAILIPPSDLAIILGAIGRISIGKLLMAIIMPGLITAFVFTTYIIGRCLLQPSIAPPYEVSGVSMSEKLLKSVKHILPVSIVVFFVIGVVFLGFATPTEAAGSGAFAVVLLVAAHRKLSKTVVKEAMIDTLEISVMVLFIVAAANAFSQVLAYTGVTRGLINLMMSLEVTPIFVIIGTQIVVFILGMLTDPVPIMMITLPMFMPVVEVLGYNEVWFGVLTLINITIGAISPPFGLSLFVMKGVASKDTTMGDIYQSSVVWIALSFIVMALVMVFPELALWLPNAMVK